MGYGRGLYPGSQLITCIFSDFATLPVWPSICTYHASPFQDAGSFRACTGMGYLLIVYASIQFEHPFAIRITNYFAPFGMALNFSSLTTIT